MINIDSHSFNNSVLEQINKIKTALTKITPDNIKYFDDTLLRKARGVVNAVDEYKWNQNSTINSVSVKTILRLIDRLKISKYEYLLLENMNERYRVLANRFTDTEGSKTSGFAQIRYEIPDLYDGRNSFVFPKIKYNVDDLDKAKYRVGQSLTVGELINKDNITYEIVKNKTEIIINAVLPAISDPDYISWFDISNTIILWRKKWSVVIL